MSYRELRNCAEMLRALGFKRLISVENFRSPNFPLVAEILEWLVKRFDPNADLPTDVDTEQDRVIFVRSVAQFMASKAHVRLNTKKLYQSDGYAVQEILKALTLLYSAIQNNAEGNVVEDQARPAIHFDVSNKITELKHIRSLASEITSRGATLYDLIRREIDLRSIRSHVISRQLELTEVEGGMKAAIHATEDEVKKTQQSIENVGSDESNLEAKIEKKKTGLERAQKRLVTLKKVRPAFMDINLKRPTSAICQTSQQPRSSNILFPFQTATRKLLEKLRTEENRLGGAADDSEDEDEDDDDDEDDDEDEDELLKDMAKENMLDAQPKKSGKGGRRVFGNMVGDLDSESLDTDTDLHLGGDGDTDLDGSDTEFGGQPGGGVGGAGPRVGPAGAPAVVGGGNVILNGGAKMKGPRMRPPAGPPPDNDDDF
ncbi:clusterin-associated protein 1-like [Macrobrachium rosenbergii]|uniref:clusterin-associated protein 1-like n=1 Tax=Macrobrachium rosenbergii TaxID=79674 RepID=UPI0034D39602